MAVGLRILTEASGSATSAWILKAIREAGHHPVGSDLDADNASRCLADGCIAFPRVGDANLWTTVEDALHRYGIQVVLPSFDEMLSGWAERAEALKEKGIFVILSPPESVAVFQDKWQTYLCFRRLGLPTPETSLEQVFPLVKPRFGRGAKGVRVATEPVDMHGMISQEVVEGQELTVDCLFDREGRPVYIVPRKRLMVRDGKSMNGQVVEAPEVVAWVKRLAEGVPLHGPVNVQCFVGERGLRFIEVNPRLAGGMALGFAATENWIGPLVNHFLEGAPFQPKPVHVGLKMVRYYAECFFPGN
ncbi:MAG: ATP-grasp domain-containing protein [Magnetococcales bacterium]|nr:ATP-grasp domain-containing protein [Magnetococcales bacterium]